MEMQMKMPKLYAFVRVASQIVAALGCIMGLVTLYPAIGMFRFSFMMGMSVVAMDVRVNRSLITSVRFRRFHSDFVPRTEQLPSCFL